MQRPISRPDLCKSLTLSVAIAAGLTLPTCGWAADLAVISRAPDDALHGVRVTPEDRIFDGMPHSTDAKSHPEDKVPTSRF